MSQLASGPPRKMRCFTRAVKNCHSPGGWGQLSPGSWGQVTGMEDRPI